LFEDRSQIDARLAGRRRGVRSLTLRNRLKGLIAEDAPGVAPDTPVGRDARWRDDQPGMRAGERTGRDLFPPVSADWKFNHTGVSVQVPQSWQKLGSSKMMSDADRLITDVQLPTSFCQITSVLPLLTRPIVTCTQRLPLELKNETVQRVVSTGGGSQTCPPMSLVSHVQLPAWGTVNTLEIESQ
jgi:hypothetical protein